MKQIVHFIHYTLGTRVTPLAYLFAVKSAILGFMYAFLQSEGIRNAIIFKQDAGVGIEYYGTFLFVASLAVIASMIAKNDIWTRTCGFVLLLIAIWSCVVYALSGFPDLAILAFIDVLMWGYVYLASYVGTLWDYKPDLDTHRPFW